MIFHTKNIDMNRFRKIIKPVYLLCILLYFSPDAHSQLIPNSLVRKRVNEIHNPLECLLTLEPQVYRYNTERWKDIRLPAGNQYGLAPENVEIAFPELVRYQNHSYNARKNLFRTTKIKTVDTESLIPVLLASVKEMQGQLDKLRIELKVLRNETSGTTIN
jgi:hypothetical protein